MKRYELCSDGYEEYWMGDIESGDHLDDYLNIEYVTLKDHLSDRKADRELIKEMSECIKKVITAREKVGILTENEEMEDLLKRAEKIKGDKNGV